MILLLWSVGGMASVQQLSLSVKHKHIRPSTSRTSVMTRANLQLNGPRYTRTALLRWFARNKRPDPWRTDPTPYSVWVAEVMLQQTVVKAALPFYNAWMKSFPDIQTLASASEKEVLRRWEGLGYYSRARNLHKTARLLVAQNGGCLPDQYESLIRLPGIGDYTASAILSIAFKKPYPVLDANVRRVVRRFLAIRAEDSQSTQQLREFLHRAISRGKPGAFNEAIMELGQTVCRARSPLCDDCPIKSQCRALALGIQSEIPTPKTRASVGKTSYVLLLLCRGKLLLQRNQTGRFVGMWSLPRMSKSRLSAERAISRFLRQEDAAGFEIMAILRARTHTYTKYSDRLTPVVVALQSARPAASPNANWVALDKLEGYPLPAIDRKITADLLALKDPDRRISPQLF